MDTISFLRGQLPPSNTVTMEASDLLNAILELLPLFCTASVGESVRGGSTEPVMDCCWRKLVAELLLGLGGPAR